MKLGRRLLVPLLLLAVALGSALAYVGWGSIEEVRSVERGIETVRGVTALAVALGDAAQEEERRVLAIRAPPVAHDVSRAMAAARPVAHAMGAIRALPLSPRAAAVWSEYEGTRRTLLGARDELLATARDGDAAAIELANEKWHLIADRSGALLRSFTAHHLRSLDRAVADLQGRRTRALVTAALGVALALATAVSFSLVLSRALVSPIEAMAAAAERVTETGALTPVRGAERSDELGTLARAFNRMTERLVTANAELSATDRRKNEFLGVLSHELRNPLAAMRNAAYVLERADPGSDPSRRARAVIGRQLDHLSRLVDDLLDVTRISRGKIDLRRERVDLAEVVRNAAEDHRPLLAERGVTLVVENPPAGVPVDGDATRLAQVVGNLLHNAAKFTPSGGTVRLTLGAEDDHAEVRVEDDGVGIEPALLEHVFEPFVQAEKSLARTDGGLGLGLALVKGLAELHGGSAAASSDGPGRGARFTVRLPRAPAA